MKELTDAQLERAADRARIATDIEIAYASGEVSEELANRLRIILTKAANLDMMR